MTQVMPDGRAGEEREQRARERERSMRDLIWAAAFAQRMSELPDLSCGARRLRISQAKAVRRWADRIAEGFDLSRCSDG